MAEATTTRPPTATYQCPHLGLNIDRTVMLSQPTTAHCCYAAVRATAPDLEHQQHYCLTSDHVQCPLYVEPLAHTGPQDGAASGPSAAIDRRGARAHPASTFALDAETRSGPKVRWLSLLPLVSLVLVGLIVAATLLQPLLFPSSSMSAPLPATASPADAVAVNASASTMEDQPTPAPPTDTPPSASAPLVVLLPTVTPEPGATSIALAPKTGNIGWWSSNQGRLSHIGDSFLYAGVLQEENYISAVRFDLSRVPRGAEIRQAQLQLTGLREDHLATDGGATWWVELLAEESLDTLGGAEFMTIFSAPSSLTLSPLRATDLARGKVNLIDFTPLDRLWLAQQLLAGATSVTVRIKAVTEGVDTRFGWDSGFGPESDGKPPTLLLSVGPPPPTPPPVPTKQQIVATFTPTPGNVLTVVAINETATSVATTVGTNTPLPYAVVTPTPFLVDLAAVQGAAALLNLPAVVPNTPTPGNAATADWVAAVATAVAQTTGTYTPVPTGYVTPILIYPSPPAENILTAVARETAASIAALTATPTPVPFNGVFAQYEIATTTPENVLTAAVMVAQATANPQAGTPTPWNQVVLLPTPLPVSPTATPTPIIEAIPLTPPTNVAIPTQLPPLERVPAELWNHILFKTTRNGPEEIFAVNPATNQLFRINDARIYDLAHQSIPLAPDGQRVALVEGDNNRILQIKIHSYEYGDTRQITAFGPTAQRSDPTSYDPAWSPRDNLIAFVTNHTGNDEIFTVDLEGQILTQLTFNRTEWDKHPSWSPDGAQIVFYSNRDSGLRRLWLMNADGSNQYALSDLIQPGSSNPNYEDWEPVWVR